MYKLQPEIVTDKLYMYILRYIGRCVATCALASLLLYPGASILHAQTKQLLSWAENLKYLQSASSGDLTEQRAAVVQIRTGIEFWLKLHPNSAIELQPAPPQPWDVEQTRGQVSLLHETLQAGVKNLFDRDYYYTSGYPEAGRNWFFNLRYRF
jgi:hypothetical protein